MFKGGDILRSSYKHKRIYRAISGFFKRTFTPKLVAISDTVQEESANSQKWAVRDTLVGVLRSAAQLDIALEHKFYHIPDKYISDSSFPIKYVAIYQSKSLFRNNAGIYYYGEVESVKWVKRNSIKEIPKNSNEHYFRFNIKEWKKLEMPIEAKEHGFIRFFTNFEMMLHSTEIPQLMLKNKELHDMYSEIKNAIELVQKNPEIEPPILHFGNLNILVELDNLVLFRHTKPINCFSVYDFMDLPTTVMTQIYKYTKI